MLLDDEVRPLLVLLDELPLDDEVRPLLDDVLLDDVPPDAEVPLLLDDVLLVEALAPLELLLPTPLLPAPVELAVAGRLVALPPVPVIPCVAPPPCPPVAPPAPPHAGTNPSETRPANKTVFSNSECLNIGRPPNVESLEGPSKRGDDVGRGTSFVCHGTPSWSADKRLVRSHPPIVRESSRPSAWVPRDARPLVSSFYKEFPRAGASAQPCSFFALRRGTPGEPEPG